METSQALAVDSFSFSWLSNRKLSFDSSPSEHLRKSLDSSSDEPASEETKCKVVLSKSQNFNFDFPISTSPTALVHADEIFSGGHILPKYGDHSNSALSVPISPNSVRPVCPNDRIHCHFLKRWRKSSKRILLKYLGCIRPLCSSRRSTRVDDIDRKVWEVKSRSCSPQVSPPRGKANSVGSCHEIKRKGTRTSDIEWGVQKIKSWSNTPQASPARGKTNSVGNWRFIRRKGTKYADTDWEVRKVKSWSNSPVASPQRSPNYFTDDWSIDSSIYEAILHCKRSFEK